MDSGKPRGTVSLIWTGTLVCCILACRVSAGGEAPPPKPGSHSTSQTSVDPQTFAKTIQTTRTLAGSKRIVTSSETRIYSAQGAFVSGTLLREIQCLAIERRLVQQGIIEEEKGKVSEKLRETGYSLGVKMDNSVLITKAVENGVPVQTLVRTPNAGGTLGDLPSIMNRIFNLNGSITIKIWYDPAADPQKAKPAEEYTIQPEEEGEIDCPSNPSFKTSDIPPRTLSTTGGNSSSPFGHPLGRPGSTPSPDPIRVSP